MIKQIVIALISGVVFGLGLTISQMTDPAKVINFLDITGNWDPSLAFVMMGALTVFSSCYWLVINKREVPVLAKSFSLPIKTHLDAKLLLGSALFGIGWGISGICPGPALANITSLNTEIFVFISALIMGSYIASIAFKNK